MTLEQFADQHNLPNEWTVLRRECEAIVSDPQFWSRPDLQTEARKLAVEASDILHNVIRAGKVLDQPTRKNA